LITRLQMMAREIDEQQRIAQGFGMR